MAKNLMFAGTSSNVGKTTIAAGICRLLFRRGFSPAPFKALNLSSCGAVLPDGREIGTGQAIQAAACGISPDVRMNPILLKPAEGRTHCYLLGEETDSYGAYEYQERNLRLRADAVAAYHQLAAEHNVIVLEGSGGCCELNLLSTDVANLHMARAVDAPVLLVADISAGGVFAAVCGTVFLLPEEYRACIKGIIVNKFCGDPASFAKGTEILAQKTGLPVLGVLPWLSLDLPKEDGPGARNLNCSCLYTPECGAAFDRLADQLEEHLNIDLLLEIAGLS